MDLEQAAEEIKRLQRCINDLVGILTLPAICCGGEPQQIVRTLLDVLVRTVHLDLVYVWLKEPIDALPVEMARAEPRLGGMDAAREMSAVLRQSLGDNPQNWAPAGRILLRGREISVVTLLLGLQGEIGVVVAGSERIDFPGQTERLLLSVAVNQAAIGLHEARLLGDQKWLASELDRRVAQRTAELKRSEALLAESQRLSSTGSFLWRVATDELTWSDQTYRIFQIDSATPIELGIVGDRVHPEDLPVFEQQLERFRSGGGDVEFELRLRLPDRSIRYIHIVARGSRDEAGQLECMGAIQDVTERRLAEEALGKARSELTHVARVTSLGVMTASIAHEVNQPLSGIVTNASTCLRMLAAEPPNIDGARETARRTIRDGHRASDVISRLRALFGNKEPTSEVVDLNEATREVVALTSSELRRGGVSLRLELAEGLSLVTGDRVQLQQVILNLILNASDAMSGVEDRARQLLIRTESNEDDGVRLTVQDTGVGFERQHVEQLFDAFYTTKRKGMGMGLSVSRSIIESHRGRLWAALNEGPGARFSFSIPSKIAGNTRQSTARS